LRLLSEGNVNLRPRSHHSALRSSDYHWPLLVLEFHPVVGDFSRFLPDPEAPPTGGTFFQEWHESETLWAPFSFNPEVGNFKYRKRRDSHPSVPRKFVRQLAIESKGLGGKTLGSAVYHGTTTVGLVCSDGVVLATDTRVTAGGFIAHKRGKKLL